jgi:hypothetical protein
MVAAGPFARTGPVANGRMGMADCGSVALRLVSALRNRA